MDCGQYRERASEYVEGTLPPAAAAAMRAHEGSCRSCVADGSALRDLWEDLAALPAADPPQFFHENVMTAIERRARDRDAVPGWRALLPQLGRVAVGTLVTGGAVAALAWTLLLPTAPTGLQGTQASWDGSARGVLPGATVAGNAAATAPAAAPRPRLQIRRTEVVDPDHGPAYQFSVWLEGSPVGTARLHLQPSDDLERGVPSAARFSLTERAPRPLLVPTEAVQGDTVNLDVFWAANGERHRKRLFVPVPRADAPAAPSSRQSFGLPESSLAVAAREVAARYGRPVTLEDVSALESVTVTATEATAVEALRQALAGRGVRVSESAAGILIEPIDDSARFAPLRR